MQGGQLPGVFVAVVVAAVFVAVLVTSPPETRWFPLAAMTMFLALSAGVHQLEIRRWRKVAHDLNLELKDTGWFAAGARLVGVVGGREVSVEAYSRGSGKSKARWVRVRIRVPRADPGFQMGLTREDLEAKIAKLFGGQDVRLNDPAFDAAFRVRSNDPERARRLLDAMLREELLASAGKMEVQVEAGEVVTHRRGGIRDARNAEALVQVGLRVAQATENAVRPRA